VERCCAGLINEVLVRHGVVEGTVRFILSAKWTGADCVITLVVVVRAWCEVCNVVYTIPIASGGREVCGRESLIFP